MGFSVGNDDGFVDGLREGIWIGDIVGVPVL